MSDDKHLLVVFPTVLEPRGTFLRKINRTQFCRVEDITSRYERQNRKRVCRFRCELSMWLLDAFLVVLVSALLFFKGYQLDEAKVWLLNRVHLCGANMERVHSTSPAAFIKSQGFTCNTRRASERAGEKTTLSNYCPGWLPKQ